MFSPENTINLENSNKTIYYICTDKTQFAYKKFVLLLNLINVMQDCEIKLIRNEIIYCILLFFFCVFQIKLLAACIQTEPLSLHKL